MINSSKPIWVDTIIGLVGIFVTLVASLNITGLFQSLTNLVNISYINLFLGLSICVIIFLQFYKRSFRFKRYEKSELFRIIQSDHQDYDKIIFQNPTYSCPSITEIFEMLNKSGKNFSIIGEPQLLLSLFEFLRKDKSLSKHAHVNNFMYGSMAIIMINEKNHKIHLNYFYENKYYNLKITNKHFAYKLSKILVNEKQIYRDSIYLSEVSEPEKFLNIVHEEKKKYIDNFINLKAGYISFHGSEVLNVQSGWLESNLFKTIKTLDLTTDPSILLTRYRYIKANKGFINKRGGIIKRVFIISKLKLDDTIFINNLVMAINLQKEIGVSLGLQFLEDLNPNEKQDFILYDDFSVLVEEKQANSDYTFGKSTAYFNKQKIEQYSQLFENVWTGNQLTYSAVENLSKTIESLSNK
ncbi:MAG: hypothetical protein K8S16_11525 [Bacteroidales bacterium]|nr:hypothetical protein [Bacteroidales bacterium]